MALHKMFLLFSLVTCCAQGMQENLIFVRKGTLPIILTVPHGGKLPIGDVPERVHGETSRDLYTYELALAISDELQAVTGAKPYIVAALFSRKYIDANRSEQKAYEDSRAKLIYQAYHAHIAQSIREMKDNHQDPLLLDIHGQGQEQETIFRGTRDKLTVKSLLERYSQEALTGTSGILGVLEAQGYALFPQNVHTSQEEHEAYSGGFTVGKYGSHNKDGIDAIQLEFGKSLRKNTNKTAKDMAVAIATFISHLKCHYSPVADK